MLDKDFIINDLINFNELAKEQRGYVKVFNYNQLNKTVYYYYNNFKTNKETYTLDDFIAEAYYFILTNIQHIKIDYIKDKDKYINYLNKAMSNNYKAIFNKTNDLYIEDVYSNNNSDKANRIAPLECIVDNTTTYTYFPVDKTYSEYLSFLLDNKENILNNKEILIINDIIFNNFNYSNKVKDMLKELNTTENLYNHKYSLLAKINRRYTIYILLNEIREGSYKNSLKYIYKDKYNNNLTINNKEQIDKLIQLLEYRLYTKEYFTTKYQLETVANINRLNVYMYTSKMKLLNQLVGVSNGN